MLLLATMTQPSTSASPVSCVRLTTLQRVAELMRPLASHVGPGQWPRQPSCIPPARDLCDHWRLATAVQYPARLAPGFVQCIELQLRWRADLPRIRSEVVYEIQQLVADWSEKTQDWWLGLQLSLQQVYFDPDTGQITQLAGAFPFSGLA